MRTASLLAYDLVNQAVVLGQVRHALEIVPHALLACIALHREPAEPEEILSCTKFTADELAGLLRRARAPMPAIRFSGLSRRPDVVRERRFVN